MPLFDVSFELSIGEIVLLVAVIALALLLIRIRRTQEASEKQNLSYAPVEWVSRDCPARFGFLSSLPRGGLIPEECYVCPRLIECLGFQRTRKS